VFLGQHLLFRGTLQFKLRQGFRYFHAQGGGFHGDMARQRYFEQFFIRRRAGCPPQQNRLRTDEGGVESRVGSKGGITEQLKPVDDRPDIDVRRLTEIRRCRGEQHLVADRSHVPDRGSTLFIRKVLQYLNAGDQIVEARDGLRRRTYRAKIPQVRADLANGIFGDIRPPGLHSAVAQRLNQKTLSASHVEHTARLKLPDDCLRDASKKLQPMRLRAVIGQAQMGGVIFSAIGCCPGMVGHVLPSLRVGAVYSKTSSTFGEADTACTILPAWGVSRYLCCLLRLRAFRILNLFSAGPASL